MKLLQSSEVVKSLEANLLLVTGPSCCFPTSFLILLLLLKTGAEALEVFKSKLLGIQEKESDHPIIISFVFSSFFFLLGTKNWSIVIWFSSFPHPFLFKASLRLNEPIGFLDFPLSTSILAK